MPEPMTIRSVTWNGLTLEEAQAVVAEAFATFNPDVTVWLRVTDPTVLGAPLSYDVDTDGLTLSRVQAVAALIEARRTPAVEAPEPTAAVADDATNLATAAAFQGEPCRRCGHGHYVHHQRAQSSTCTMRLWDSGQRRYAECPCESFSTDAADATADDAGVGVAWCTRCGHVVHDHVGGVYRCRHLSWDVSQGKSVTCDCQGFTTDDTDAPTDGEGDRA